jgi:hypothetical protein
MNPVFLYGEVDLPKVPDALLSTLHQCPQEKHVVDTGYGKTFYKDTRKLNNSIYDRYIVDHQPLIAWMKNTVPAWRESEAVALQKQLPQGLDKDTVFPVHHDVRRMFALNYILTTGGDSVTTSWFKDVNQPLVRSLTKQINMQTDTGPVEYKDLEFLSCMICEPHKWYLIRTNILHDVDHVDGVRSALTVPYFDTEIVDIFKQKSLFKNIKEI